MHPRFARVAALLVALCAMPWLAMPAQARIGSCGGCGTVTDVDKIWFARDKAPADATVGTIIGSRQVGGKAVAGAAPTGLVGRDARGSARGDDAAGLRLEVKMDGGGQRTIEIVDGVRVYKGDRVRVHHDRIEMVD